MERALLFLIDSVGYGSNFLIKSVLSTLFHCLSSLVSSRHSSLLIGKKLSVLFQPFSKPSSELWIVKSSRKNLVPSQSWPSLYDQLTVSKSGSERVSSLTLWAARQRLEPGALLETPEGVSLSALQLSSEVGREIPLPQSLVQLGSVRCAFLQGPAVGYGRRKDIELSFHDPGSTFSSIVLCCYSPCPEICYVTRLVSNSETT